MKREDEMQGKTRDRERNSFPGRQSIHSLVSCVSRCQPLLLLVQDFIISSSDQTDDLLLGYELGCTAWSAMPPELAEKDVELL